MEIYKLENELKVFGKRVSNFPEGIQEAFDELIKMTGDPAGSRSYYGISEFTKEELFYHAAAEEKVSGEAEKNNCTSYTIEKGTYLTAPLHHWRAKVDSIKNLCDELVKDDRTDKTKPCVEWYKNDDEMWCMIRTISQK